MGLIWANRSDDLATLWPHVQSICVVPVGLTKHHKYDRRPLNKAEMRAIFDEVTEYQQLLFAPVRRAFCVPDR